MQKVETNRAPSAIGPYSQAIIYNGIVYTSGQIALKPNGDFLNGDISEQTEQVLKNLSEVLKEAGSSLDNIIKTTIYLVDMGDFSEVNSVYGNYFKNHKPARSTIAVKELPKGALIEIEAIAKI